MRILFKYMNRIVVFLLAVALSVACAQREQVARFEGFALGTVYSVSVKGSVPERIEARIDSVFAMADNSMSVFNKKSLLSRLNRNETDSVDTHIDYCVDLARGVSELSDGKYDITILPLVESYGFSGGEGSGEVNVDSLLAFVGYRKIAIRAGRLVKQDSRTRIDLNSIAKGYVVDLLARMLEEDGVSDYLVNVGGEIFCRGTNDKDEPWTIGIETPVEGNYVQGASVERLLAVQGMGVATSGNYRNFRINAAGRKYTHIIDPTTGASTQSRLLSASVVASTCAEADALATMFIAMGLDNALRLAKSNSDIAALLIFADEHDRMLTFESEAMKPYLK
jgi:thiamine biosynthesis lipoprotein